MIDRAHFSRSRGLALVLAVALSAAACSGGDDGDLEDAGSEAPPPPPTAVCATEFENACRDAGFESVTVEEAGATVDRLRFGQPLGADVWVTTTPWPGMVESTPGAARLLDSVVPVASTDLAIVTRADALEAFARRCPPPVTWACAGGLLPLEWNQVGEPLVAGSLIGISFESVDTSTGLLTIGALTAGYFEPTVPPDALTWNDVEHDPQFDGWLSRIKEATRVLGPGDIERYVGGLGASFGSALEVEARATVAAVAGAADTFTITSFAPSVTTHAVAVGKASSDIERGLTSALVESGWEAPTASTADAATGLPNSGVMVALRQRWHEL